MSKKISKKDFYALKNGDEAIFKEIMKTNFNFVQNFIRKLVKIDMDSEELAQDVFLKLWQNRESLKSTESFYGFLFTLARNTSFSHLEKKVLDTVNLDDIIITSEFTSDVEDLYDAEELSLLISLLVEKMPDQRKKVYLMSRVEGLSRIEIADKLGISKNTVSNHLNAALEQIKKSLPLIIIIYFTVKQNVL